MTLKIAIKKLLTTLTLVLLLVLTLENFFLTSYADTTIQWDYQGTNNPQNWGQFSKICNIGKQQSPINIELNQPQKLIKLNVHYQDSSIHILNNGHTVRVNCDRGSYIVLDNQFYEVQQFHYHSPSEHSLNGKFFPAELHIVHRNNKDNSYAIVGVLLQEGKTNSTYQTFIDLLPSQPSPEINYPTNINLANLLPTKKTAYSYFGSFTTPPCTEGVNWLLMSKPVELSAPQIEALQKIFYNNNRPIQQQNLS